ncbi:MAG: pantetheine-phosphate adenylyltransferase [Dehalococcoidales bacterium]
MTIALYPGTFDPITNGHLDIAIRAAKLFEKVIIGVYDTPSKNLLFNTAERMDLASKSVQDLSNIEVQSFTGLTVAYAKKIGARTLIRGLRAVTDFEREFDMAMMNKKLTDECELVLMAASLQYQFLSSSLLKEVASLGGDIDDLVPGPVAEALKQKISGKKI